MVNHNQYPGKVSVVGQGQAADLGAGVESEDELHKLEVPHLHMHVHMHMPAYTCSHMHMCVHAHLDSHVLGGGGEHVLVRGQGPDPAGVRLESVRVRVRVEVPDLVY